MFSDMVETDSKSTAQIVEDTKANDVLHEHTPNPDEEPTPHLHAKTFLIVFAVMVVYMAQLINLTGCGAYGRAVAASVGGAQDASWLVVCTVLMVAVFGPPVSQAADYWGRRWFLIGPTACGVVGSIILARATSMPMAIAGEAILSLSYAAQPLLHAVASEVLTHRNRAAAQAAVNVGSGIGACIGLLAGSKLTAPLNGFRNFWYMTAGAYALGVIVVYIFYTPPPREQQLKLTFKEKISKLDGIGFVLLCIGLTLFVMGLSWGENPYPWKNGHVLGPLLIGVSFLAAFVIYEWKFTCVGMVHHDLFSRDRNFAIALGCVFSEGLIFFAANVYFPYQVGLLYEVDGTMLLCRFYCLHDLRHGPAIYCYRYKRLRAPMIFAFSCFLAFNICMATTTLGSGTAVWGYPVLLGCALSVALCVLVTAAQLSTPPHLIAITSGLMISMRSIGGIVGVAIYTAVFNSRLADVLERNVAKAALPLGLPPTSLPLLIADLSANNKTAIATIPGITPLIIQASSRTFLQSFVTSFRGVWITASTFATAALIASFFVYDPINDFTQHIDAPAEREEDMYGER
ncbi:uncharacterized protein A1O5_09506 [Cladophialophora psammophila CBS 110553]|uniref:Major facilitator superfamily (MFS) profile domain-containing protein n=1 Tax=Cladophialophora psammophila CBS 110553 TaxID=1182543 RepID=W9WHW4_9EURO|nr:uncharacterized protein A1O5_09506 [Cladophialophora psammophila CBS 110553]EXJ67493.1 hypothetical protein A1O5_09506 [Cladophialophora psammophila CBS 110553]